MSKFITYPVATILFVMLSAFSFLEIDGVTNKSHLFKIERSKDANEIFYDIHLEKSGKLNVVEPIFPYWRRQTEGGIIKPLTWVQQNYAYGLEYIYTSASFVKFRFVSYKKRDFFLKKDINGNFKVYTLLNNKEVEVNRIFIQIDGGTFWFPKISRVELHASDPFTKKNIVEIIKP
ncbi:MAG: DUF4833 domain-containing protein [Flavobacteriales bacterium]